MTTDIKASFGLTQKNIEVIKTHINKWEGAEFDRNTWVKIGEEIKWEPITACLWYFKYHRLSKDESSLLAEIESLKEQLAIASEQVPKEAFTFNSLNSKK